MTDLFIGMPLLDVLSVAENGNLKVSCKNNILNFCRQEMENGDTKISNEIELAMLTAWLNNSENINMPELLGDDYELIDVFSKTNGSETTIYEEFLAKDSTYYLRSIVKDENNVIKKVSLSHNTCSSIEMIKNGGVQDCITDTNNDGYANRRTIIKNQNGQIKMINDINLDGKAD